MLLAKSVYPQLSCLALRLFLFIAACSTVSPAADYFWDTSSTAGYQPGSGTWSTATARWTTNGVTLINWPSTSGNGATFAGSTGSYAISVTGAVNVDSITVLSNGYTVNGGTINLQNKRAFFVPSGVSTTINSTINSPAGLIKHEPGTLTLTGRNAIVGAITVDGGVLKVTEDSSLGISTGNNITIQNGATLDLAGTNLQRFVNPITINGRINDSTGALINTGTSQQNAIRKITLGSHAAIGNSTGNRFDIGRGFSGTDCINGQGFTLTKVGSNEVSILANASNLDSVAILGGCLIQENSDALDAAPIYIGPNGTLSSYNTISLSNNLNFNGGSLRASISAAHTTTYSGSIYTAGNVALRNEVANSVILNGAITGSGSIVKVGTGKFILTSSSNAFTGGTTITGGSVQIGNGGTTGILPGNIINNDTLIFNRGNWHVFGGSISGNGVIIKNSDSIVTLTGNSSSFAGTTVINTGALTVGMAGTVGSLSGDIVNNSKLRFNRADSLTYSGIISGTGSLTKWGNGVLILTGNNTYTGGTSLETGTLQIGAGGITGSIAGNVFLDSLLIFKRSDRYTFPGIISGNGTVAQAGTGILTLSAQNTYVGTTYILSGTLRLNGSLGDRSPVIVASGATLSGSGNVNGRVTVADGGILAPGDALPGRILIDTLTLTASSQLNFDIGTINDTIELTGTGMHTLAGLVNLFAADGLLPGEYRIISYAGTLSGGTHSLTISGTLPGYTCSLVAGTNCINLKIDPSIPVITRQSTDTLLVTGETAVLSVSAAGAGLSYSWKNSADLTTTVSTGPLLTITDVTSADSGNAFVCIVSNSLGADTSNVITLSVIRALSIISQSPSVQSIYIEDTARFTVQASGTPPLTYSWYKVKPGDDSLCSSAASFTINRTMFGDSGFYFCILSNAPGRAKMSDTMHLIVNHIPPTTADLQPDSLRLFIGEYALFTARAHGTAPFTFLWFKVREGPDSLLTADSDSLTFTATPADNGNYYCVIGNPGGTDTTDVASLVVRQIPPSNADIRPDSIVTSPGRLQGAFTMTANGSRPFTYRWYHEKPGVDSLLQNTGDSLKFDAVSFSDSGRFYCVVSNSSGADTSDFCRMIVRHLPPSGADSKPDSLSIYLADTASFIVTAEGSLPLQYEWYLVRPGNDSLVGVGRDSLRFTPATISDSGSYYCIVKNPGGADTTDTVRLAIKYRAPKAAFSLTPKYGLLPLSVLFSDASTGTVTSRLWKFGDDSTSSATSPAHLYKKEGSYTVTLVVSGPGGVDSCVKRDSVFAYTIGASPIRMTGRFLSGTSVAITLSNLDAIDTLAPDPQGDSIGLWIRPRLLPASTSDGTLFRRYPRSVVRAASYTDTIVLPPDDSLFGVMSGIFWNDGTVSPFSPANGCIVLLKDTTPPTNPLRLTAETISSDSIRLHWNPVADTLISNVRVWYGRSAIDTVRTPLDPQLDSFVLSGRDTMLIIRRLLPGTNWFFGIQVARRGIWSMITPQSRTSCSTPAAKTESSNPSLSNMVVLDTAYFDSLRGAIRIFWHVDSATLASDSKIAVSRGFDRLSADTSTPVQFVKVLARAGDTIACLNDALRFDTTYFITLRILRGNDSLSSPTDSSGCSVRTGHPSRQIVTLFAPSTKPDTVAAFNGSVLFWKDSDFSEKTAMEHTVDIVSAAALPKGMVMVGTPFRFNNPGASPAFYIGFRIMQLPTKKRLDDVRIYTDSAESFFVDYTTRCDTARSIVFIKTRELDRTFFAMIDTVPPRAAILSDTGTVASSNTALIDSLLISDNIANVHWNYSYSRGDEVPLPRQECGSYRTGGLVKLSISDTCQVISSEAGLRAYLTLTDGIHFDTVNLSRSVIRSESDRQTTESEIWTPVSPTAILHHSAGASLIANLHIPKAAGYDRRYMKLFRWVDYPGNNASSDKWVEYDPDNDATSDLFSLVPGRLVWLKTRGNTPFHLDTGTTLSLKDTFTIDLPAQEWTDFGMPFRFGVRIEEILSATGKMADSVQFYCWNRDSIDHLYRLKPLYVPGMPDKINRTVTIDYLPRGGYSLFNRSAQTITLRIPPVLPEMAKNRTASSAKQQAATSWSSKFTATDESGAALPPVYCGYAAGMKKSVFPPTPSFSTLRAWVFDRVAQQRSGHYICEDGAAGLTREIQIENSGDISRTLAFHLETAGTLPEGYRTFCYNAQTQTIDTAGSITIDPQSTASRWIITGDATYCNNFLASTKSLKFMLGSPYPNPARSAVNIRYTVPFGAEERIRVAVYNMLGKIVWEKRIDALLTAGQHVLTWNGRDRRGYIAGSGMYIVQLTVVDKHDKPVKRFDRRVTLLR